MYSILKNAPGKRKFQIIFFIKHIYLVPGYFLNNDSDSSPW